MRSCKARKGYGGVWMRAAKPQVVYNKDVKKLRKCTSEGTESQAEARQVKSPWEESE